MTGSPLRKKISREKLEALRGEYKTTKLNGKDHNELVCYNYRPEPILRIPANQIVTVLPRKISAENSDYNILHFIDGKDLVLDYVKSTETGSGALKEEDMPSMHFALTKVKTLPESFLADFPLFGGSAPLKTFDMNEAVLRLNDRGHHNNPRVHVLLCEQSGTGRAKVFFEQVLEPFLTGLLMLQQNVDFDVHETTDPRDYMTRNLARDVLVPAANQGKKRTVIVCSGDGGIVDLLNGPLRQCARERYVPLVCEVYISLCHISTYKHVTALRFTLFTCFFSFKRGPVPCECVSHFPTSPCLSLTLLSHKLTNSFQHLRCTNNLHDSPWYWKRPLPLSPPPTSQLPRDTGNASC